jgi:hypothetical protein
MAPKILILMSKINLILKEAATWEEEAHKLSWRDVIMSHSSSSAIFRPISADRWGKEYLQLRLVEPPVVLAEAEDRSSINDCRTMLEEAQPRAWSHHHQMLVG